MALGTVNVGPSVSEPAGSSGSLDIIKSTIYMSASSWVSNGDGTFSQPVTVSGVEADCIIELQPDDEHILQMVSDKVISLRVDNDGGVCTAVAIGAAPTVDLSIQATVTGLLEELPEVDIVPIERGGTGAKTAAEARTNLGAAAAEHNHSEYAASNHTHSEYAASNHTHSEYAASNHTHSEYAASNHTHSEYAAASHKQAASTITAGTFAGQVKAGSSYESYSTYLLRNTRLASSDTTPSNDGEICWTYE